jgi:hypothetical protein
MQQWDEKVIRGFESFPGGGYFVERKTSRFERHSFSDEVRLKTQQRLRSKNGELRSAICGSPKTPRGPS